MGVEPRRNPEIVVCALLEEGEHGYLAARTAAQVIKAYVEKQRRQPPRWRARGDNGRSKSARCGAIPAELAKTARAKTEDRLQAGRFFLDVARKTGAAGGGRSGDALSSHSHVQLC